MYVWMMVAMLLMAVPAQAEWYVAGDALHSNCSRPAVDGTWKQDLITGGSEFGCGNIAWDSGVGYRFNDGPDLLTDNWSVELGYRDYGSASAGGNWVSDDHYTQVMAHGEQWLDKHGIKGPYMEVRDAMMGGYGRIAKGFLVGPVEPYVAVGWFGGIHTMTLTTKHNRELFHGMVSGPTFGGGIKWHLWHGIKARAGAEFLQVVIEDQHPVSSQWWTVGGGIEVPFTGWR